MISTNQYFYLVGVPTFFPPKIPAKPFLSGGRSGKRSNSSKAMSEKRLSIPYRRACHGQDIFFAGFIDQDPHGKSLFFLSGSSCIPEGAFLSGDFGREKCWDPKYGQWLVLALGPHTSLIRRNRSA